MVTQRYIELYEHITGNPFIKGNYAEMEQRIERNVNAYLVGQ
jgi:phosphoribosylaminoimidazole-succinocarboxamide synthase